MRRLRTLILVYGICQYYKDRPLPTMTKGKHWALYLKNTAHTNKQS